ncbi:hypothetical protein COU76_03235 [Candidatus Peregrinibacteria bacterium CG10_big_fil_rev_8_21_14_0_10_49_10]|nr:MAG: hypothetical protein COU76_03235 [Candidatus Peregrinibacteria bacterium CG10_big_fil_rev_8_21_14_0_10_49_10]
MQKPARHSARDYDTLIAHMQFYSEPNVSWSQWLHTACIQEGELTELGAFLASRLEGGVWVDIPCGLADASGKTVMEVAQKLGVRTLLQVDHDAGVLGERLEHPVRTVEGTTVYTHCADVLEFLAKLPVNTGKRGRAIYISGLQPQADFCRDPAHVSGVVVPYLQALYSELERVSAAKDLVILNEAAVLGSHIDEEQYPTLHPAIALVAHHFCCRRTCPHNKVQVFEKL